MAKNRLPDPCAQAPGHRAARAVAVRGPAAYLGDMAVIAGADALGERIRRGDEQALDQLLEDRWAPLVTYVAARVGDIELAKDIAQDAFVRLWEHRREIDPGRSVAAYLYQVARSRAIDELRKRTVRARWLEREQLEGPASVADNPLRQLADREVLSILERAIQGLPARPREAFTLVHVQGLSYKQAAEVMGSAPQTVANQVAAALAELRRELRELLHEPADTEVRPTGHAASASRG